MREKSYSRNGQRKYDPWSHKPCEVAQKSCSCADPGSVVLNPILCSPSSMPPAMWKPSTFKSTGVGARSWGGPWQRGLVRLHLHFLLCLWLIVRTNWDERCHALGTGRVAVKVQETLATVSTVVGSYLDVIQEPETTPFTCSFSHSPRQVHRPLSTNRPVIAGDRIKGASPLRELAH